MLIWVNTGSLWWRISNFNERKNWSVFEVLCFFFFFFFFLPITIGQEVKRGPMAYMPSWNWGINLKLLLSYLLSLSKIWTPRWKTCCCCGGGGGWWGGGLEVGNTHYIALRSVKLHTPRVPTYYWACLGFSNCLVIPASDVTVEHTVVCEESDLRGDNLGQVVYEPKEEEEANYWVYRLVNYQYPPGDIKPYLRCEKIG